MDSIVLSNTLIGKLMQLFVICAVVFLQSVGDQLRIDVHLEFCSNLNEIWQHPELLNQFIVGNNRLKF